MTPNGPSRRLLDVRLGRPLDVILRCSQDVRLGRPQDVSSAPPEDCQIRSLWDVLRMLDGYILGTFWGPIFAGWVDINHIGIITVKNVDYRCIIHNIGKSEAIN